MAELLFLQHRPVSKWKELAETSHRKQYVRLLEHARSYLDRCPPEEHPDDSITYIGAAVANMGLAYLLSGDKPLFDAMRKWIACAINYPHWGKHRKPDYDLDAAWLLLGLSLAYDWLKEEFPIEEKEALRDKLILQGRRMFKYVEESRAEWKYHYWQNHNWICFAGLATAGYAIAEELPESAVWCSVALDNFKTVFSLLPDDGSDYEGPAYWRYGVPWLFIADALFEEKANELLRDLSGFLKNTFYFRLYISAPNLIDTANFGDCHDRRSAHSKMILYRVARLFENGHAQWLAEYFDHTGEWKREEKEGLVKPGVGPEAFWEFLWFEPSVKPESIEELPLQRIFPDLGLVSVRTGWDSDSTVFVYKCGQPSGRKPWTYGHSLQYAHNWHVISAGHAHPDENSFILASGPDYLVVDEGYNRSCYSRYHSTLLVDEKGQYKEGGYNVFDGLGHDWGGRLEKFFSAGSLVYVRGDASGAYDKDLLLERFSREILFLGNDWIVISDRINSQKPHSYQWLLQTDKEPKQLSKDSFIVETENRKMGLFIHVPSNCKTRVIEQEVVANPTSANPNYLLKRQMHTFEVETEEKEKTADFLVSLCLSGYEPEFMERALGRLLKLSLKDREWLVGFKQGASAISLKEEFTTDADWIAIMEQDTSVTNILAGNVSSLWWEKQPFIASSFPVDIAISTSKNDMKIIISSLQEGWLDLRMPGEPQRLICNGEEIEFTYRRDVSLLRFAIPIGNNELIAYGIH
ncbi:DUF4962 domain-containing protein [Spirochaetia bacterium 38H-sp]|uniref:DUF4962 domain-containing protein n=1 Tax=Rarispira pelagica TaxID=3141764 RepID=A0ABU9UC79_9SPIR